MPTIFLALLTASRVRNYHACLPGMTTDDSRHVAGDDHLDVNPYQERFVRKGATVIALVLAVGVIAPSGALGQIGAPVVDQSFMNPGDPTGASGLLPSSGLINGCCNFVGQTFTAGRDGVLTGINLVLYEPNASVAPEAPVRVSIRNTDVDSFGETVPGQTAFVTTVVHSQVVPLSQLITFPHLLQIRAGVKYAIVLNLENPDPSDVGGWVGAAGEGGYPGGEACGSEDDGVHWLCDTQPPSLPVDNHFRTCVSPSPASNDVGPSAVADSASIAKGSGATTINVLGNDSNADGGPMALVGNSDAAHGTVALADCGADLTYTPDAYWSGSDSFTYTLNGGSTAAVSVTVTDPAVADTRPPQTIITKSPPNKTEKTSVKFKFRSDEPNSTFECKLDKKQWKPCTSAKTVKRLDEAKHKFRVRAIDHVGNVDPTPAKEKFKVIG